MDCSQTGHVVANCELFKGIDTGEVDIVSLCQVETYSAGEEVFHQGDFGEHLYIIAEGRVFLERCMDLGARQGKVTIGPLGKGRVFGCWSTLLGQPHNLMSSAICLRPTTVVVMKGADLRAMMIANASFGFNVLEKLCFVLRNRIQDAIGAMEKI